MTTAEKIDRILDILECLALRSGTSQIEYDSIMKEINAIREENIA